MHGLFRRRNLPHLDVPGGTYFVTFCLAGSLPSSGRLRRVPREPERRLSPGPPDRDRRVRNASEAFADLDRHLDENPTVRWLADPGLAALVRHSLLRGHGSHYELHAYVVMPSHCHVVLTPNAEKFAGRPAREAILQSIKRYTAIRCNALLGRQGRFWQTESYDRLVRGPARLERVVAYVEHNPVKAGLCTAPSEWKFSSAAVPPEHGHHPRSA